MRAAAPVVEPAGLHLDMLRPRRSAIVDDRVERPEFSCRSMRSSKTRASSHRATPSSSRSSLRVDLGAMPGRRPTNSSFSSSSEVRLWRANPAGMPAACS
jgi:hypothetical protein